MKAALYLRSSKDRSDVSIDAQRRALQELAEKREITIVAEYADAVESGKDDDRPGFQSMLRDMRSHTRQWDTVIALDTARIARRRHLSIIFEEVDCKKRGIKVIYKSLPESDPITEMLLKSILQAMDEWHSLTSKAKGLAGMAENVKQGWRAGGRAPKGYKLEHVPTGAMRDGAPVMKSRLVINDDAMLVRSYLQNRARGLPRARAMDRIDADWPATTLLNMERNALIYAGHTVWNKHSEKGTGQTKFRPREEWVIQHNTHEALITDAEADKILALIGANTKHKKAKRFYMLTGLLVSETGERWHADGEGNYRLGKGKRILAEWVDKTVLESIVATLSSDEMVEGLMKHYKGVAKKGKSGKESINLQQEINTIDRQISNLTELLSQTTAGASLLKKIEELDERRQGLIRSLELLKEETGIYDILGSITKSEVKQTMKIISDDLNMNNPDHLRDVLPSVIESVVLDSTTFEATVTFKFGIVTGDKLASPRGVELIPGYLHICRLKVPHGRRLPPTASIARTECVQL